MDFADAWIGMWGLSYIACSIIKPDIFANISPDLGRLAMIGTGSTMLAGLALKNKPIGRILLAALGIAETFGGVASWSGLTKWNIPFENKEIFNVSMAAFDLISAATLLYKSFKNDSKKLKSFQGR